MPNAHRVRDGDSVLYLMPFEDAPGRRVLYEQDIETFETSRHTVGAQRARTLVENGCEVSLGETPAWADPQAPSTTYTRTAASESCPARN